MFTSSGLHVRFLKVFERSQYQTVKWVRYITKAGSYEFRMWAVLWLPDTYIYDPHPVVTIVLVGAMAALYTFVVFATLHFPEA